MAQEDIFVQRISSEDFFDKPEKLTEIIKEYVRARVEQLINTTVYQEFVECQRLAKLEGDSRQKNGYYARHLKTVFGDMVLKFPRFREDTFSSKIIGPYQRNLPGLTNLVLDLYDRGLSSSEVAESLINMGCSSLSAESVMKIARGMLEEADKFMGRSLAGRKFPILFLDGTWMPLKRIYGPMGEGKAEYEDECVMVAIGVDSNGHKEVLGFKIVTAEGANAWEEFLGELVSRGLDGVKVVVTDGLNGMPEAIRHKIPEAAQQRCCFHLSRNISQKTAKKKRKEAVADFKKVYTSATREEAEKKLDEFLEKWARAYPELRTLLSCREAMLRFYDLPRQIRKAIYTSNTIEGFNAKMKRELAKRISLNSLDNAKISVASVCRSYNQHCRNRLTRGFGQLEPDDLKKLGIE